MLNPTSASAGPEHRGARRDDGFTGVEFAIVMVIVTVLAVVLALVSRDQVLAASGGIGERQMDQVLRQSYSAEGGSEDLVGKVKVPEGVAVAVASQEPRCVVVFKPATTSNRTISSNPLAWRLGIPTDSRVLRVLDVNGAVSPQSGSNPNYGCARNVGALSGWVTSAGYVSAG